MSDLSNSDIVLPVEPTSTEDLFTNLTPSQRYYLKNRQRIIQKNKERVLNKYHQSASYIKNKERRENKRALKIKTDELKNRLNDITVKIKMLKMFIDELKNKELDIRIQLQDIIHEHRAKDNDTDAFYNIIEPLLI